MSERGWQWKFRLHCSEFICRFCDPPPPIRTPCQNPKMMENLLPLISSLRVQHGLITSSRKMFASCVKRRGISVVEKEKTNKTFPKHRNVMNFFITRDTPHSRALTSNPFSAERVRRSLSHFCQVSKGNLPQNDLSRLRSAKTQSKRTEAPFSHLSNFAHVKMREEEMKGSLTRPL